VHPLAEGHTIAVPFVDAAISRALPVPVLTPAGIAILLGLLGASAIWMIHHSSASV